MLDTIVSGVVHGNAYALVAVGLSLIFGVTNIVNFAQGSVFGVGTMLGWFFVAHAQWPFGVALVGVLAGSVALGYLLSLTVLRPLASAPPIAALLATFAASLVIDNVSQLVFGPETRPFPPVLPTDNLSVAGIRLGTSDLVMFALTAASMTILTVFLRRGRIGRAIRATAQDPDAARQMGVPVARVQTVSVLIASGLGGLAGVFVGLYASNVSPTSGTLVGIVAFVAATIGGLGSIVGAVVGGFVLGVVEAIGVWRWGEGIRDLIVFGLLLVVLMVRPAGLLDGRSSSVTTAPLTGTFLGAGRAIRVPRPVLGMVVALAVVVLPLTGGPVVLSVGYQVALAAVVAVPLTLLSGAAGQVSLGQVAPVAVGAYASTLLVIDRSWPFLLALPAAGVVAAVLTTALSLPIWKLTGHYVAIATLALGFVAVAIIRNADWLTRGAYGISGIPFPQIGSWTLVTAQQFYLLDLVVLGATLVVVSRLRRSHLGTILHSVGSDETAARSLGIRARDYKALAYAVAAFFAGIAGALTAHQNAYLDPSLFGLAVSTLALAIVVLGGMGSPGGAVLGAVVLVGLPELLRLTPEVRITAYGVVLVLMVRFWPQGLGQRRVA